MNKIQLSRWNAAKKLFQSLIAKAELASAEIWFDDTHIQSNQIIITDDEIMVKIDNSYFLQFSANPEYDEGLFTRKVDYAKIVKSNFKLVKNVKW